MRKIFYIFFLLFFTSCNNEENESIAVNVNFQESNLPIVMIDTYGEDILDEPRIDAYMGVINNANGINNVGDNFNDYDGKITIEKRGNSSQDQEKPPYRFETVDKKGNKVFEKYTPLYKKLSNTKIEPSINNNHKFF